VLDSIKSLRSRGFSIYATEMTSRFLKDAGADNTMLYKVHENRKPNISDCMARGGLDLVINVPDESKAVSMDDEYHIRRMAVDFSVSLITNLQLARLFVKSINSKGQDNLKIKAWNEY
ncbi:MAG: carbamoyl phosphate synthase large subunit, partial [Candidatus Aenigmarchaeota archaeon]|nr:carbamoyl phosphate synthase large subunit [Candidatus Aenigmarchaeota archaeon]